MEALRPPRKIVRRFWFPIACIVCIAWIAGFGLIYFGMARRDLGVDVLLVFSALTLLLPWLGVVVSIGWRMYASRPAASHAADSEAVAPAGNSLDTRPDQVAANRRS